jgi:tetratricopeptide (TPR) repeat protein
VAARPGLIAALALALAGLACAHDARQLGIDALARGDDREAVRQLERALQHGDDDAAAWRDLARAHQRAGNLEAAYRAIVEAARRAPEDPSVVLVRAQLRFARDDRSGAASDARWLLPRLDDAGDLERLAVLWVRLGNADAALAAARQAVDRSGDAADAYGNLAVLAVELRRFDAAQAALREGRARHPRDVDLRETEAAFLLARGDLPKALLAYRALLPRHARPGLVHLALALIEHELGEHDAALLDARAAVELEGRERADVHYTLAVILLELGRDDEARRTVHRSARRFPDHAGLRSLAAALDC